MRLYNKLPGNPRSLTILSKFLENSQRNLGAYIDIQAEPCFRSPQLWVRRPQAVAGLSAWSAAWLGCGPAPPSSSAATPTKTQLTPVLPAEDLLANTKPSFKEKRKDNKMIILFLNDYCKARYIKASLLDFIYFSISNSF